MITPPSPRVFACSACSELLRTKVSLAPGLSSLWGREAAPVFALGCKANNGTLGKCLQLSSPFSSGRRGGKQIIARRAFHVTAQKTGERS